MKQRMLAVVGTIVQYLGEQVAGGVDATGDGRVDILITARHVDFVLNGGPDYHAGVLLYSGLVFNQPVHTFSEPPAYGQHPSAWQNFGISIDFVGDIEGPGTALNGLEMGNNDVLIVLNQGPNAATRFDEQLGSTDVARHGQDMASSGLPRVYIPGQSFTTVGFLCFTNWDNTSPGPVALTSTEYH